MGISCPTSALGPAVLKAIRPHSALPFDVHLMIAPADPFVAAFAEAGADHIAIHVEAGPHLYRSLQLVRSLGKRAAGSDQSRHTCRAGGGGAGSGGRDPGDDRKPRLRRAGVHRVHSREDPHAAADGGRDRAPNPNHRRRRRDRRNRPADHRRQAATRWWQAPPCSARRTIAAPSPHSARPPDGEMGARRAAGDGQAADLADGPASRTAPCSRCATCGPATPRVASACCAESWSWAARVLRLRPGGAWGEGSPVLLAAAHGFTWLRDLRALGTDAARGPGTRARRGLDRRAAGNVGAPAGRGRGTVGSLAWPLRLLRRLRRRRFSGSA